MDARLQILRRKNASAEGIDIEALEAYGTRPLADALRMTMEDVDHLRDRGLAFIEAGQLGRALAVFEMLIALGAADPATLFLSAGCAMETEDIELARVRFHMGLALARPEEQALVDVALIWGEALRR